MSPRGLGLVILLMAACSNNSARGTGGRDSGSARGTGTGTSTPTASGGGGGATADPATADKARAVMAGRLGVDGPSLDVQLVPDTGPGGFQVYTAKGTGTGEPYDVVVVSCEALRTPAVWLRGTSISGPLIGITSSRKIAMFMARGSGMPSSRFQVP